MKRKHLIFGIVSIIVAIAVCALCLSPKKDSVYVSCRPIMIDTDCGQIYASGNGNVGLTLYEISDGKASPVHTYQFQISSMDRALLDVYLVKNEVPKLLHVFDFHVEMKSFCLPVEQHCTSALMARINCPHDEVMYVIYHSSSTEQFDKLRPVTLFHTRTLDGVIEITRNIKGLQAYAIIANVPPLPSAKPTGE